MYEKKKDKLIPRRKFIHRLMMSFSVGFGLLFFFLLLGMIGYHGLEKLSWLDSFLNASMILSGMGPVNVPVTIIGKLFAGMYALVSGLVFILIIGIILAPIAHRIFHKFHIDDDRIL